LLEWGADYKAGERNVAEVGIRQKAKGRREKGEGRREKGERSKVYKVNRIEQFEQFEQFELWNYGTIEFNEI